jgi:hypothetical protein
MGNSERRYELTFPKTVIPPRQHVVVQARPEVVFRGHQIFAAESKAGTTRVLGLFVHSKSQFPVNPHGILSSVLTPSAFKLSNGMKFDICEPGCPMTFIVANDSDEPVEWQAMIIGDRGLLPRS